MMLFFWCILERVMLNMSAFGAFRFLAGLALHNAAIFYPLNVFMSHAKMCREIRLHFVKKKIDLAWKFWIVILPFSANYHILELILYCFIPFRAYKSWNFVSFEMLDVKYLKIGTGLSLRMNEPLFLLPDHWTHSNSVHSSEILSLSLTTCSLNGLNHPQN